MQSSRISFLQSPSTRQCLVQNTWKQHEPHSGAWLVILAKEQIASKREEKRGKNFLNQAVTGQSDLGHSLTPPICLYCFGWGTRTLLIKVQKQFLKGSSSSLRTCATTISFWLYWREQTWAHGMMQKHWNWKRWICDSTNWIQVRVFF